MEKITRENLYNAYGEKVLGYIFGKVHNRTVAEDLTSCVFVKALEKYDSFDEKRASVSTWIYTITKNTVIDYFRTKKQTVEFSEQQGGKKTAEDEVICAEDLKNLAAGLKSLDEAERKVIVLRYYSEKKLVEIAKITGYSYSYTKVLEKRGIKKLKDFFEKQ